MLINNNRILFDDFEIKLVKVCGIYVILRDLVFSLNDGKFAIQRCQDDEEAIEQLNYVCRMLKYNPNFLKVDGINALVNVSQLDSFEKVYVENYKQFGVKLNYSNQEIGLWNSSKRIIDKACIDLENNLLMFRSKDKFSDEMFCDEKEQ